jgi:hypothetical protein
MERLYQEIDEFLNKSRINHELNAKNQKFKFRDLWSFGGMTFVTFGLLAASVVGAAGYITGDLIRQNFESLEERISRLTWQVNNTDCSRSQSVSIRENCLVRKMDKEQEIERLKILIPTPSPTIDYRRG